VLLLPPTLCQQGSGGEADKTVDFCLLIWAQCHLTAEILSIDRLGQLLVQCACDRYDEATVNVAVAGDGQELACALSSEIFVS
jgi:hypothetical protein